MVYIKAVGVLECELGRRGVCKSVCECELDHDFKTVFKF